MNDENDNPKNDDWAMTAPNVNFPKQEKPDDWSMPEPVFRVSEGEKIDNLPKRSVNFNRDEADEFDKTAPNFNFSEISPPGIYGATVPNLNLRAQSSVSEPFPANQVVQETSQTEKAGGLKLIFVLGGLIVMLFLGIVALAGVIIGFRCAVSADNSSVRAGLRAQSK